MSLNTPPTQPPEYSLPQHVSPQQIAPQQPLAQYAQPQYAAPQRPLPARNAQATAAFVFAIIGLVTLNFIVPVVRVSLLRTHFGIHNPLSRFLIEWGGFILGMPLLIVALGLGLASLQRHRPSQGKTLAYVAIGAAGFGFIGLILSAVASGLGFWLAY